MPLENGIQLLGWTPVFTGVTIMFAGITKSHFLNVRYFNRKVLGDA
jgi:hypothetical protein